VILITGGLGFLGGNMGVHLLQSGKKVLLTRNRSSEIPAILAPYLGEGLEVTPMDVRSMTTICEAIKKYKVESIIHGVSIYEGRGSLGQAVDVNVTGTQNVLEAARLMNVGRVTFVSSEGVNQGRKGTVPLKEEEFFWVRSDRYIPVTKKMAELLCMMYQKEYKMDIVITDIELPEMDGWTVLDQLKYDLNTRHIPVHILSVAEDRQRGLNQGALAFLNKKNTFLLTQKKLAC
jgi:nucleoside-diphosphate-sugar epimerase